MALRRVCRVDELPTGSALRVDTESASIAIFNVDGSFFATHDQCTHGEWSLADSYLVGDVVECALHGGRFCVRTGEVLGMPAVTPLRIFPVQIADGEVFVDVEVTG